MAKVGTKEIQAVPVEDALTEDQTAEFVDIILVLDGQNRYQEVLQIWSTYIGMVFEQERTKDGQGAEIRGPLQEQEKIIRDRATKMLPENSNMIDAAELMAIQFIAPIVEKAFDFSTYSGAKRCEYIQNRIREEIEHVKAQIDPVRHILDLFKETE